MLTDARRAAQRTALHTFGRLPVRWRRRLLRAGTPTWVAGAVVVLRDEGDRVLLVRSRHHQGWGLPGGLLNRGEGPLEAVLREVHEEVGLQLSADDVRPGRTCARFDAEPRQVTALYVAYVDQAAAQTLHGDGIEIIELDWFADDALPARLTRGTAQMLTDA